MRDITLYGTSGCHLCEEAEALLAPLLAQLRCRLSAVDIGADDELLERYGVRIPVLRRDVDGAELGWPFTREDIVQFLREAAQAR
jgi:hypothetical protein